MKNIKKVTALITSICIVIGLLSGCTAAPEGKALYDAMLKAQTITSSQTDFQYTLRLDATGLSEEDKVGFEQMKAMLNETKLSMSMKQTANADNTAAKVQADATMSFAGMSMDMDVWADLDLSSNTPTFKEIIKMPAMFMAMDPSMAGKEYMVMDFAEMMKAPEGNEQASSADYSDTLKFTKEFQEKATAFMGKYLAQYDPGFKLITDAGTRDIVTPERTVKAHVYQVKLDDKAAKKLIRYTVNNLAENNDAMDFMVEYVKLIEKFTNSVPGAVNPAAEFDKLMADFEKEKPAALAEFNKFMDQIENIQLVGDKGITLEYAVDEKGYLISQSGSIDFVIDPAKLDSIEELQADIPASEGVYNVGVDFSMLSYNINKDMTIEMPVLTPENSIDYADVLKAAVSAKPAQALKALPTASKVLVNGKVISFDAYTIDGNNYFKIRDIAKAVKGTQKQFDVNWDAEKMTINLISNKAYSVVGGEMAPGDGKEKVPVLNASIVLKDGVELPINAYTINGNNYFKLRDIAKVFNIGITWNGTTNTIGIDTTKGYVEP